MNHDLQKNYFEIAYRTGSDVWTHIPYSTTALHMLPPLPKGAMVLDVGVGRGIWLSKLVHEGYRVIGIDYIPEIVRKGNADLKREGLAERARFINGDVRDLPLVDHSFDAVTDIGVLQHLGAGDWANYISELKRVLKPEGYVLNISLSKETSRFMGFRPKTSEESTFEKFNVSYHFFTTAELNDLFAVQGFKMIAQHTEHFDARTDPGDSMALTFSLYQAI